MMKLSGIGVRRRIIHCLQSKHFVRILCLGVKTYNSFSPSSNPIIRGVMIFRHACGILIIGPRIWNKRVLYLIIAKKPAFCLSYPNSLFLILINRIDGILPSFPFKNVFSSSFPWRIVSKQMPVSRNPDRTIRRRCHCSYSPTLYRFISKRPYLIIRFWQNIGATLRSKPYFPFTVFSNTRHTVVFQDSRVLEIRTEHFHRISIITTQASLFSAIPHISFRILEDTKQFFGRQLFRIRKVSYYHIKCFGRNGIYPHSQ